MTLRLLLFASGVALLGCAGLTGEDTAAKDGDDDTDPFGGSNANNGTACEEETAVYVFYRDADGDGYGDIGTTVNACEAPEGYVPIAGDCDDTLDNVNPDGVEVCDNDDVDQDCDGLADDDDPSVDVDGQSNFHPDRDGDSYGDPAVGASYCDAPSGWVTGATDCDDGNGSVNPGAAELCDGVDNDCDGYADPASSTDARSWYADGDGDTYGDESATRRACERPDGFVTVGGDCDDTRELVNPAGNETCNGHDDDCDGTTDEDDAGDATSWFDDADGDGYGDDATETTACDQPVGYVSIGGDCNDAARAVNPSATEVCDSSDTDEDCDGNSDDDDGSVSSSGKTTFYADSDGDGYGDAGDPEALCDVTSGYVSNDDDCDDGNSSINPAGSEVCDSADADEDCDGNSDDDDSSVASGGKTTYYRDSDGDGYGVTAGSVSRCDLPSGYATLSTDCDDTTSARSPANTEVCDSADLDEDCDSLSDDSDPSTSAASKTSYYTDSDGDGYGSSTATGTARCSSPGTGYASNNSDCDDADAAVSPAATDECFDGEDSDCDGADTCELADSAADRQLIGEEASDNVGYWNRVVGAGDLNADGYDDILLGAPGNDRGGTSSGAAYVVRGGATGDVDLASASSIFTGEDASDLAGSAVAGVGDVTGDGKDDVLVGAPGDDAAASNAGIAYFVKGAGSSIDLSVAQGKLTGVSSSDAAGGTVGAAGDVSGDGTPDLLVGAASRSSGAGAVYLLTSTPATSASLSTATATRTGESSSDAFGGVARGVGDTDGDGYDDFVVGAVGDDDGGSNAGAVYLFCGPLTGSASASTADAKLAGPSSSDAFGTSVAPAGDHDADGYADFMASAPSYGNGHVYVVNGPVSASASVSSVADADFAAASSTAVVGYGFDGGGDVDGDDRPDAVVGAYGLGTGGMAFLYLAPFSGTLAVGDDADAAFAGSVSGDSFGAGVTFIGDHDGDGLSDFAIGAWGEDTGGSSAGSVWVYLASGL